MRIERLELEGFRNYAALQAQFSPGVNVIYGENAQGKTNLLEAVEYLSGARTHRTRADRELIGFGRQEALLRGQVESRSRTFQVEVQLFRGRRRRVSANGVRLKTAGELSELLHTVLFCPEDLLLIRAGSAERRQALQKKLDLPAHLTANGLLEALNLLYSREEVEDLLDPGESGALEQRDSQENK